MDAIIATIDSMRTRAATSETLITLAVPTEYSASIAIFLTKIGHQVGVAFADVEKAGVISKPPKHPFGEQAKALRLSGFFRRPEVWKALGSDEDFRHWVQRQPSAWSGDFGYTDDGQRRCEAAHVSRIAYGRGHSHKPEYACIPLTHKEHALSHGPKSENALGGREWFEKMRIKHVETWAWETLKHELGAESMGDVEPAKIGEWAKKFNVEQFLPDGYRQ